MRVAVDCRFLSLPPSLMTRGIPRYAMQQLRAVLRLDRTNNYVLLHRAKDDTSLLLPEIRQAPNVTLQPFPGESRRVLADTTRTLRATEDLERWLTQERIDLFHATVPWLPVITVFPAIDTCPVLTTVYDLIPSLFTEHLQGEMKNGWALAVEQFRRSTRLLAISGFTARDLSLHLGIPPDRIDVAYPFAEPFCAPLAPEEVRTRLADLRRRIALPERFAMTVSFLGFRNKNLETLLDAYRHLPVRLRRSMPLVVVGIQGPATETLRAACRRYGIEGDVIATGVISDAELAALYNAARMLICPSRYEGFGLPVAEAMQSGTPVVTTTQSSMPEVTGGTAWLVDAEDARGMAEAIAALADDDVRRAEMRRAGLERAKRFTSEALGRDTLAAYQRTVASAAGQPSDSGWTASEGAAARWTELVSAAAGADTGASASGDSSSMPEFGPSAAGSGQLAERFAAPPPAAASAVDEATALPGTTASDGFASRVPAAAPDAEASARDNRPRVALCLRTPLETDPETRAALDLADALAPDATVDLFAIGEGLPPNDLLRRYRVRDLSGLDRVHALHPYDAVLRLCDSRTGVPAEPLTLASAPAAHHGSAAAIDLLLAPLVAPPPDDRGAGSAAAPHAPATASAAPSSASSAGATGAAGFARPPHDPRTRTLVVPTDTARAHLAGRAHLHTPVLLPGVADPLGPQPRLQREQARAQLVLPTTNIVVGWLEPSGELRDAQVTILAFADLCHACPEAWLLVGGCDPATLALPAAVAQFADSVGMRSRIRALDTRDAVAADACLLACDIVIAIDVPGRVAAPHAMMRACAAGKPIVVGDSDAWRWLPDAACWRVPSGATAGIVLGEALRTLARDRDRRDAMGRAARAAYEAGFTLPHLAARCRDLLGLPSVPSARHEDGPAAPPAGASAREAAARDNEAVSTPPAAPSSTQTHAHAGAPAPRLGFNRVCCIEDFEDPELVAEMRDVMAYKLPHFGDSFPRGVEHCKDWEVAMATRTLRHFGALHADASILGVAAGMEDTIFYLTRHVREVMTVDRYAQSGVWQLNAPMWMLVLPEWGAPEACVPERLVVQHMDARRLRFPDDRFDGIFSSGSIEHFGGLMDVAHAAYEMGRVLKPGGILSLATVMSIAGPPDRMGTPGTCLMFQRHHMERYIVEASGLELVDTFVTEATPATHAIHRSLEAVLLDSGGGAGSRGVKGQQESYKHSAFPCIALDWDGVTFDSVHLALRKPNRRSRVTNAWARPTAATDNAIVEDYRKLIEDYDAWMPPQGTAGPRVDRPDLARLLRQRSDARAIRHVTANLASDLAGLESEVVRTATQPDRAATPAIDDARTPAAAAPTVAVPIAGPAAERSATETPRVTPSAATSQTAASQTAGVSPASREDTWVPIRVTQHAVPPYTLLVDRADRRDIVANAFLQGHGALVNSLEFSMIRAFVQPGDAVIDAGAHLGSITLPLAAIGCRVLSVEASSRNATLLRASVAYNGFRDVRVVCAAAAAEAGTLSFLADGAWGWVAAPGEATSGYVPAVRLEDLVDLVGWERVALIKIDVEGSELAAITGLSRILSRPDGPVVYYESNTHTLAHAGVQSGQVVAALEAFGYRSYVVKPGRLTRVHPGDTQEEVVLDHLAIKGPWPTLAHVSIDEGKQR